MEWDRSRFAMSGYEQDVEDALQALRRLLEGQELPPLKRGIVTDAVNVLASESQCRPSPTRPG